MGRITAPRVLKAMEGSGGIIAVIAKKLSVTRQSLWTWFENNPEFKKALKQQEENVLDLAENKLIAAVDKGESWAIKYMLSCRGKHRGYQEKEIVVNTAIQNNTQVNQIGLKEMIEKAKQASWSR